MGREAGEHGAGGDGMAATRRALAPGGSRPPAVLVLLVALLVAGTIVASVVGTLSLTGGSGSAGSPLGPAAAPPELATPPAAPASGPTEAAPTAAPTAERPDPPADPRSVFQDPELRTFAQPFLSEPAASCERRAPGAEVAESVSCDLGGGRTAVFSRLVTPDAMRDQRRDVVAGQDARAGTVVSVRWRYVGNEPETRAGIPPPRKDRGEGVRVRFVDQEGVPRLYFDQDSSGCTGDIALTRPTGNNRADLETLRRYWSDPVD